jgi:hypothetical protein
MVFEHIMASEPEIDATVSCKVLETVPNSTVSRKTLESAPDPAVNRKRPEAALNSPSFWGLRNATQSLRVLTDKWLVDNKPVAGHIAYSDHIYEISELLEPWNSFMTSFRHVQITLELDFDYRRKSTKQQLDWLVLQLANIMPRLHHKAGPRLTVFLLARKEDPAYAAHMEEILTNFMACSNVSAPRRGGLHVRFALKQSVGAANPT